MNFDLSLFITALGLACVLEALPWLIAPDRMREAMRALLALEQQALRTWGFALLGVGTLLVWLARS